MRRITYTTEPTDIGRRLHSSHSRSSQAQTNARSTSFKASDGGNDDREDHVQPFHSREAARVVLDSGSYQSRPESEPRHRWEPIHSASPAAVIWNEHLDSTMRYLTRKGIKWTALHLGLLNQKVTIAVLYEDNGPWDREVVERELRYFYFPHQIFTDIVFSQARVNKGAALGASEYSDTQSCGAGVGVRGVSWSAGTVGGYFESETGELYGLTCHHVLLPTKTHPNSNDDRSGFSVTKGYPEYLDTVGLHHSAFKPEDGAIEVVQPPCVDHFDTLLELQALIKNAEEGLKTLKAKYEVLGIPVPKKKAESWQAIIKDSSRQLAATRLYNRTFGTVISSSGYKVDLETKGSIDWGLFEISRSRSVWNMIPGVDAERRRGSWDGLSRSRIAFNGIADPMENESVFKIGRKTGPTFGIINGVRDGVNLKENLGETEEWCVVGTNGTDFSATGDSGSLVFNQKFQVIGIVTAGCDSMGGLTYMTPIKLVLHDILKTTGIKIKFWDNL
ncbi:hypothetical protein TWF102_002997 [Orbilia oligospora]|uniref:Peptidase S1 domain-containing protein n=1 Tax=Orbilia oligospora TaxID=2813651 RepID=A0A7C8NES0_ORBOL|nr:hypothetical protein TWF102_002997 [Orbilia oligospora]